MSSEEQSFEDPKLVADAMDNNQACASKEGKGKRLWKKVKYQLVEYHSLPHYLRDNEYIIGHYRPEWPLKQVLLSMFTIHNETLNVWTHLIGFFLFLALTIYTAMKVPDVVDLHALPDVLKNADLHKLHEELMTCLPSLPNMPALNKLREELKTSLPSMDLLPSLSGWHVMELLNNCLPQRFSHGNHTDVCVLVMLCLYSLRENDGNATGLVKSIYDAVSLNCGTIETCFHSLEAEERDELRSFLLDPKWYFGDCLNESAIQNCKRLPIYKVYGGGSTQRLPYKILCEVKEKYS